MLQKAAEELEYYEQTLDASMVENWKRMFPTENPIVDSAGKLQSRYVADRSKCE